MANKKQVLIVEDDSFLQGLMANKLEKSGFDTTVANNGEKAVTELKTQPFDIVLLDLMLPDISGFDILESLKENARKIPVIVFSNLSDDKDIKKAMSLGAREYLIKSNFTLEELIEKVEKIVS
jgi:DNA-binding response OmpR family regulator